MFCLRIHSLDSLLPHPPPLESPQDSEASSSSKSNGISSIPNPPPITNNNTNNNDPRIQIIKGTIHLYRNGPHPLPSSSNFHSLSDPILPVGRGTLLFVLAVPSRLSTADFLQFCGSVADQSSAIRVIRNDAMEDRYSVLVKFDDQKSADTFYYEANNWRFPEGEVCHILHLDSVEYTDSTEIAGTPPTASTELPTCSVCLERLDQDISGIIATTCDHSFQCSCISKWANSSCSVCHFCQERSEKPACSVCGTSGNLWICVICGFVGCGRERETLRLKDEKIHDLEEQIRDFTVFVEAQKVISNIGDAGDLQGGTVLPVPSPPPSSSAKAKRSSKANQRRNQ